MSWIDETLAEFGRGLNLPSPRFNRAGVLCLEIEGMGRLVLERVEGAVVVCLTRKLAAWQRGWARAAMALCHYREGLPLPVNAALGKPAELVFAVRVPDPEFSLPLLERAIDLLQRLHQKIGATESP